MRSPGKWMRPPKCFSFSSIRFRNVYFISVGSRIGLVDFYLFQCDSKPKFNYENKDDKKFKVVLRRLFLQISKLIFSTLTRNYAFSRYSTDLQLSLIQFLLANLFKKMQKYKIIEQFFLKIRSM